MGEKCWVAIRMTADSSAYYCKLAAGHAGPHAWQERK